MGGADPKTPADAAYEGRAQGVVGDKQNPSFELAAGDGLGDVVEQRPEAQPAHAVFGNKGTEAVHLQLLLYAPDDLEDVVQGIQVVVGAAFQAPGQGEFGDEAQQRLRVRRGFEGGEERAPGWQGYRLRRDFLRLVFGLGRPLRAPGESGSPSGRSGFPAPCFFICSMRRLRLRSTKA